MDPPDLINRGLILRVPSGGGTGDQTQRTIIVSGIGRSGTSMIASVLAGIGVLSAADAYPATMDDREFLHLFRFKDTDGVAAAIQARDSRNDVWAFKLPSIHGYMEPDGIRAFRNPRMVMVFRDPVATAIRHSIAEYVDAEFSFFENIQAMQDIARFMQSVDCPMLLVSYEKAISFPDHLVLALAEFCGVSVDAIQQNRLRAIIQPDNRAYAENARRRYEGNIDGIIEGFLHGWCREADDPEPVLLDLLVDGAPAASFRASLSRNDLRNAGIGDGSCGFRVDLGRLNVEPSSVLTVRVAGRSFEVAGSGKPARAYRR